jgi:phosphohistidine phosphatase SixA
MSDSDGDDTGQEDGSLSRREAIIGASGWAGGVVSTGLGVAVSRVDSGGVTTGPSTGTDGGNDDPASGPGGFDPETPPLESVVDDLREGGYTLYFRHERTQDGSDQFKQVDESPEAIAEFEYDDPTLQRNLSLAGWRRAESVGEALDTLGIPVGTVLSSPFCRCRKSAELTVGATETTHGLNYTRTDVGESVTELMTRAPDRGTNTALFAHTLSSMGVSELLGGESLSEGMALVLDPERALEATPVRLIGATELVRFAAPDRGTGG